MDCFLDQILYPRFHGNTPDNDRNAPPTQSSVEFYLYPTVGTVLINSIKPELTE